MSMWLKRVVIAVMVFVSMFTTPRVFAFEIRSGDSVTLKQGETVSGTFVVSGNDVVINGDIRGDIYCAGKSITITGTIEGDVICAAQTVAVKGLVNGSIRTASQQLEVSGSVGRNITSAAQDMMITKSATVSGESFLAGQVVNADGSTGPIMAAGSAVAINGKVDGDILTAAERFSIGPSAVVRGAVSYMSDNQAVVSDGAGISGVLEKKSFPKDPNISSDKAIQQQVWPVSALPSVLFAMLSGLMFSALLGSFMTRLSQTIHDRGMESAFIGFVALIGSPVIILGLLVSIIGLFLIPAAIFAYILAIWFGRLAAGLLLGRSILEGFRVKDPQNLFLQSLTGIPVLWFMFKAPLIGGLFGFFAVIVGLGAVILSLRKNK